MVTVVKPNGKLPICIDQKNLNKAIKREYYPMKNIEEIAARMPNATTFSVLDARSGFWQLKLDDQSAKLCTFNTPFGRYMFKRLPFGISSAQDVFQAAMSDIFEDIDGVEVVVDDILVWGSTIEEHDTRLEQVLQRAQERNLKLNKDKSQIRLKEISYIGHIFSHEGVRPDPKKVQAITQLHAPKNKEQLQGFLGMTTYLSKFIPNYSQTSAQCYSRRNRSGTGKINKRVPFPYPFHYWKNSLSNAPVLRYFNPYDQTTISVDASSKGMGAVLLQDGCPIAYASKSQHPPNKIMLRSKKRC